MTEPGCEQLITTVRAGTGSTFQPAGILPLWESRRPSFPVEGSRCNVAIGPAAFTQTVVVFVFLFFRMPVVDLTLTGLKST